VDSYSVEIKPSAAKELESLSDNILTRVVKKIEALATSPRPSGCKKLKGYKDQWRVRVGDWRIVYIIDDFAQIVRVTRIAHRSDVYES
jgi:mRNA interferase RelE/StbE